MKLNNKVLDSQVILFADFKLIPEKTALIIVDMQYYDAHPDYGLGKIIVEKHKDLSEYFFPRLQLVLKNCIKLVEAFRERNLKIFYVTFGASLQDGIFQTQPKKR